MRNFWLLLFVLLPVVGVGQVITTYAGAGSGSGGYSGDGGPATTANIGIVAGIAFDSHGNLYIGCPNVNRVRKVDFATGIITTCAGNGTAGYGGDGGPATLATLKNPIFITLDTADNLYISDVLNHRIRKVDHATGIISTYAGTGIPTFSGDGGPATAAAIYGPDGLACDNFGNLFFSDNGNKRIRKIDPFGTITTYVGTGATGYIGDGIPATAATISNVQAICLDSVGNLFIGDHGNARVSKIDKLTGVITTIAGNGTPTYVSDGVPATNAQTQAWAVAFSKLGNLHIADYANHRVRMIDNSGVIQTVAGNGIGGFSGDGGPATAAKMYSAANVIFDQCGNLYIADNQNQRVRKVSYFPSCDPTLETEQIKPPTEISIYPNPATTELTISAPGKIKEVTVYDLLGRIVETSPGLSKGEEVLRISVAGISPGIYFVRIVDEDGGVVVRRVVKE